MNKNKLLTKENSTFSKAICLLVLLQPILDTYYFYTNSVAKKIGFTLPPIFLLVALSLLTLALIIKNKSDNAKLSAKVALIYGAFVILYCIVHCWVDKTFYSVVPGNFGYSLSHELYYIVRLLIPFLVIFLVYNTGLSKKDFVSVLSILSFTTSMLIVVTNVFCISLSSYTNHRIAANIFAWFGNSNKQYTFQQLASKGFFSYANQISVVLLLLFPISCIIAYEKATFFHFATVFFDAIAMLMLGTKVAAYGLLCEFAGIGVLLLLHLLIVRHNLNHAKLPLQRKLPFIICLMFVILCSSILLNRAPAKSQLADHSIIALLFQQSPSETKGSKTTLKSRKEAIVFSKMTKSEKEHYIICNYKQYHIDYDFLTHSYPYQYDPDFWFGVMQQPVYIRTNFRLIEIQMVKRVLTIDNNKMHFWFGMSASREANIFKIEKDFVAQYYSLGIIGLAIFEGPLLFLGVLLLIKIIRSHNKSLFDFTVICSLLLSFCMCYVVGNSIDNIFYQTVMGFSFGYLCFTYCSKSNAKEILPPNIQ